MAAAVDFAYLSNHLSIPQQSLSTVSTEPTADLVASVLQAVAEKAREHDETKSENLRLNVELENVVRRGETKARGLKSTVDKGLQEISNLRQKLQNEETSRQAAENELQHVKSSTSASTSELDAQRSRIASLESSNRDTLALLESKSTAHDRLGEELAAQHQKTLDLRKEVSSLEQSLQEANSASTTAKFRESNLEQEIELVRRNNEWFDEELKTKNAELAKMRKEKGARIAELQRQNEDSISTIESLRRTETTLRNRLEEVGQKADGAFAKIQQLQEDAAQEHENFRKELESAQRLAQLYEESAKTARDRLHEVQLALDQSREDAAEEVGRIQSESDSMQRERDAAEQRNAELEERVERQEAELSQARETISVPGTPRRDLNGASSPGRDLASPGSARMKSRLNITQMYSEYTTMKTELGREKQRNQQLSTAMDEMIQDLESKQPEMEELRSEHERLQSEVSEMTNMLDEAGKQRDQAKKDARKWESQVEGLQREGEILRQQLRDLSAQVKVLLSEVHARDEGLDGLDANEQMQIERLARGELDPEHFENQSDTGRLISQRLTVFKNIADLQEQNMNLLRITRDLGEQMEGEEAVKQKNQQALDREELESLRTKVEKYKDEIKSLITRSQSYIKERDMFRRMLQHRGQIPANADLTSIFGQSVDGGPPATPRRASQGVEQGGEMAEFHKTIKELTQNFDAYREEASADHRALKEQADRISREKGELQAEIARSNSQVTLSNERLEMLQSNYNMLKNENIELQKRSHSLAETAARQDLRTQQVAEELIEAKALADSMRSETANLKAEKDFWKKIEKRLSEDNESLLNERSRLNKLIADLQNLQNERELSESESRRKTQAQIETLEKDLQAANRKLSDEVEDAKKLALRHEYDQNRDKTRIDDLVTALGTAREDLAGARSSKDHLQARVDELTIELKSAEERVQVLQPRPSGRPTSTAQQPVDGADSGDPLSREQQLGVEVSELRRDLDLAKSELESAKKDAEKYQEISASAEEELQNMNDASDQYKEEMDRTIAEKETEIRELKQRVEDITSELSNANAETSSLRTEEAEKAKRFEEQSAVFEAEISRLKDQDERHTAAAQYHQEDLKTQAEIAQQAQRNYENELLKHAEAAKALQKVREDYNELKTESVQFKTEAEAAQTNLSQSEHSWEESKEMYERELEDLRKRREDVNAQNKLLHEQLENMSKQLSSLQQNRTAFAEGTSEETSGEGAHAERSTETMQNLISYLRREKEIVEVQHGLVQRESQRYKQQLDQLRSQLDETRLKLDQERRAQNDSSKSAMTHKELVEKINELNLYRESTITLRNEARQAQAQLAEKTKEVEELVQQIQPLRASVQELEEVKETQLGEMKLLQEDRDRYQQRMQNILQKYDRIDPAELEALKEQISTLQAEKESFQGLKEQVDGIPELINRAKEEAVVPWREQKDKLTVQFKERHRAAINARNEKINECNALIQTKEHLEAQIASLNEQLATSQSGSALAPVAPEEAAPQDSAMQDGADREEEEEGQVPEEQQFEGGEVSEAPAADEAPTSEDPSRISTLEAELSASRSRVVELESQITELQQSLDQVNAQLGELQANQGNETAGATDGQSVEELERLRQDLASAQQEVDNLKAHAASSTSSNAAPGAEQSADSEPSSVAQQVSEQVAAARAELEAQQAERIQEAEGQFQTRADRMKKQLSQKLQDSRVQVREELETSHNAAMEKLREEHSQEVERIKNEHQQEIDRFKAEEQTRFNQEKQIWLAENAASKPAQQNGSSAGQPQPSGSVAQWTVTDVQARELLNTNSTLLSIMRGNISTQTKKVREEQEKTSEEKVKLVRREGEIEKEKAVAMEVQRQRVKLSMAEGRSRTLTAKIEIVSKAATETPQRAVIEVWEIAKNAKPPPQAAQTPTQTPTKPQPSPISTQPQSQSRPQPQSATQSPAQGQKGTPPQPPQAIPQTNNAQAPQPKPPAQQARPQQLASSPQPQTPQTQAPGQGNAAAKPDQPQQNHPNAGTGPGALRGILGQGPSGIPRGGGGPNQATRGGRGQAGAGRRGQSQLPRGGPRGRGGVPRGGAANANAPSNGPSQQVQTPTTAGNPSLNAGAKQFIPGGNKRPREESSGAAGEVAGNKKAKGAEQA